MKPITRKVVIESPYAGDVQGNTHYARRCVRHALERGDAPLASHLLYTQTGILDDTLPEERKQGMEAGFFWLPYADAVCVYVDRGVSPGMIKGIHEALERGVEVELCSIHEDNTIKFEVGDTFIYEWIIEARKSFKSNSKPSPPISQDDQF